MILYEQPIRIELAQRTIIADERAIRPSIRTFSELADVLKDQPQGAGDAYYMYREVMKSNDLRYDITVIPQWKNEDECAKTYGHCHPVAEKKLTYPEVYQVLDGDAFFILQKELMNGAFFVSIVEAEKGDVLLIPPNFCHASINAAKKDLLLANIVADVFTPNYSMFKRNHGAAYYVLGNKTIVQNPNYIISGNERVKAGEINKRYSFESKDLLTEFSSNPGLFEFLKKPSLLKLGRADF